jgi:hypothetical protein
MSPVLELPAFMYQTGIYGLINKIIFDSEVKLLRFHEISLIINQDYS